MALKRNTSGHPGGRATVPRSPPRAARGAQARVLRIIGGTWRGRKLRFPRGADIRPTPDRVRETLFNWLAPRVPGARCLDLFAGSGALGLEALSRGAGAGHLRRARHGRGARAPRETRRVGRAGWRASSAPMRCASSRARRGRSTVVFLDPPFGSPLLGAAAALLEERGWLEPGALIYVECRRPRRTAAAAAALDGAQGEAGGRGRVSSVCADSSGGLEAE